MDTIKEEEKYGNTGEKFASTSQAIVNGSARFAKFANSIIGVTLIFLFELIPNTSTTHYFSSF